MKMILPATQTGGIQMTANKVHVFYTDPANGWCAIVVDENEFQIGEGEYSYHKSDAVARAKRHELPICIFGRNGLFQRTVNLRRRKDQ